MSFADDIDQLVVPYELKRAARSASDFSAFLAYLDEAPRPWLELLVALAPHEDLVDAACEMADHAALPGGMPDFTAQRVQAARRWAEARRGGTTEEQQRRYREAVSSLTGRDDGSLTFATRAVGIAVVDVVMRPRALVRVVDTLRHAVLHPSVRPDASPSDSLRLGLELSTIARRRACGEPRILSVELQHARPSVQVAHDYATSAFEPSRNPARGLLDAYLLRCHLQRVMTFELPSTHPAPWTAKPSDIDRRALDVVARRLVARGDPERHLPTVVEMLEPERRDA